MPISKVTMEKPCQFAAMTQVILSDAKHFSFYYDYLSAFLLYGIAWKYHYLFDEKGWAVIYKTPNVVEVKYIFVYPEHRRKGFFKELVKLLQKENKRICVCTKREGMRKALVRCGFHREGLSLNGSEEKYILQSV